MSIAEIRKRTAAKLYENHDSGGRLPCMVCGTTTPIATLSDHGARCFPCYAAYCRAEMPAPPQPRITAQQERSPRAWAYRLKQREQDGERLREHQRQAWREALRHEVGEAA